MKETRKVISLFSGCGGLDIPFSKSPYKLLRAYDNDVAAIKCLNANFNFDAKPIDVTSEEFDKDIAEIGEVDIVLGGFPCQGFSKSGPKKINDPRNKLYLSMVKAIETTSPKIFIAENVDGMAQNFNGVYIDKITKQFESIGYTVESRIINAVNYGVAQYRRRIFFVGVRNEYKNIFKWPKPTHKGRYRNGEFKTIWDVNEEELAPALTIKDVISDLINDSESLDQVCDENQAIKSKDIMAKIKEGQKLCNVRFSETSVYTWMIPTVFGKTTERQKDILLTIGKNRRKKIYGSKPNGNPLSLDDISSLLGSKVSLKELRHLVTKNYLKEIDNKFDLKGAMFCSGLYKRPLWDEPSPTVITVFGNPRYFFHPKSERPFTVRECARLQSFPDEFKFCSTGISINDAYRLIGNAVAPKVAEAFENEIDSFFSSISVKNENKSAYA